MNPLPPYVRTFTDHCILQCFSNGDLTERCVHRCVASLKIQKFFWQISCLASKVFQEINQISTPTLIETSKSLAFTAGVICLTLYLNRACHEKDSVTSITKVALSTLGIMMTFYAGSGDLGKSAIYTGIVTAIATINLCSQYLLSPDGKQQVKEPREEHPIDEVDLIAAEIQEEDSPDDEIFSGEVTIRTISVDDLPGTSGRYRHQRKKYSPPPPSILSQEAIPHLPTEDVPEPIRKLSPQEETEIMGIIKTEFLKIDPQNLLTARKSLEKFRVNVFSNPKYTSSPYEEFRTAAAKLIKARCAYCDCKNKFDVIPFLKTLQTCPVCQVFCYCSTHKLQFKQEHQPACH